MPHDVELDRALDKILNHIGEHDLSKAVDDVWDELDDRDEANKVRLAHILQELQEVQEAVAELQEHAADHEERTDGMGADLLKLMHKDRGTTKPRRREEDQTTLEAALEDHPSAGTRKVKELIKSLAPGADAAGAQRLAVLLKSWVARTEAREVPYTREHAATLRQTHGANVVEQARTMQDLALWQQTGLLPARYEAPQPMAKSQPWAMQPQFGLPPVDTPAVPLSGPDLRKALQQVLADGTSYPYAPEMAERLVLHKGISIPEMTAWKRSGVLRLDPTRGADVDVPPALAPAKAAILLTPAELGKRPAQAYGRWTPQRQAAQRAQDLAALARMAR